MNALLRTVYRSTGTLFLAGGLIAGISACTQSEEQSDVPPEFLNQSKTVAKQFRMRLKSELSAALSEAGPVQAIGVCQSAAPAIAQMLADKNAVNVQRIARKNREAGNALSHEYEELYAQLEASPFDGDTPRAVHAAMDGKLVYMQAIPMQEQPCSTCHGTKIDPSIMAAIGKAYPNDRATGFSPGDLRGAFLIEREITQ